MLSSFCYRCLFLRNVKWLNKKQCKRDHSMNEERERDRTILPRRQQKCHYSRRLELLLLRLLLLFHTCSLNACVLGKQFIVSVLIIVQLRDVPYLFLLSAQIDLVRGCLGLLHPMLILPIDTVQHSCPDLCQFRLIALLELQIQHPIALMLDRYLELFNRLFPCLETRCLLPRGRCDMIPVCIDSVQ